MLEHNGHQENADIQHRPSLQPSEYSFEIGIGSPCNGCELALIAHGPGFKLNPDQGWVLLIPKVG
jgi:hypothetical protein